MQLYFVPQNLLLRALMRARAQASAANLQHVSFDAGQQLWAEGDATPHALFPLRGAISLQLSPGGGKHVEIAIVGREGFAGAALLPGSECNRTSAVAIAPGEALVMSAEAYGRAITVRAFRAAIERFTRFHLVALSYTVICNRVHVIEKVCVGRLLQVQDRIVGDSLQLTQDIFAKQLGVRRASISRAVTGLQKLGAIAYDRRGRVTIADRSQLERLACTCYHTLKSEFDLHVAANGGF